MHGRRWSSLSGNDRGSVSADVDGQDIISVEGLVLVLVLRAHFRFLSTIKGLCTSVSIHDDTQGGNHVQSLALGGVPSTQITCSLKSASDFVQDAHLQILLAVGSPVAIDMLDLEFLLGGILVCLCKDRLDLILDS